MRFVPELGQVLSKLKRSPAQETSPTQEATPEVDLTGKDYQFWNQSLKDVWGKNATEAEGRAGHVNSVLRERKFDHKDLGVIAGYIQRDLTLEHLRPTPEPQKGKTNQYKRFGELKTSGQLQAEKLGQDYINQVTARAQEIATFQAQSVLNTREVLDEATFAKYLQIAQDAAKAIGQLYREKNPPDEYDIRTKMPAFSNQFDLIKSQRTPK